MALHNVSSSDMGANQTIGSIGSTIPPIPTQQSHYATPNLGSAVSSSMHLTNSSHDSDVLGATSNYKTEHDMMYYSVWENKNHTTHDIVNPIKIIVHNYSSLSHPSFKLAGPKLIVDRFLFTEYIIWIELYHRWVHQFHFARRRTTYGHRRQCKRWYVANSFPHRMLFSIFLQFS